MRDRDFMRRLADRVARQLGSTMADTTRLQAIARDIDRHAFDRDKTGLDSILLALKIGYAAGLQSDGH